MTGGGDQTRRYRGAYGVLAGSVLIVAAAGYFGYALYPRFGLPASQGVGLLSLAAASGFASFFSPCSFPLLITLLGGDTTSSIRSTRFGPAQYGAALALGAAVFLTMVGVAIAAGGRALFAGVAFTSVAGITIRAVTGVTLIVFGLSQAEVLQFSMHGLARMLQPRLGARIGPRRRPEVQRLALFGFGYVLAGFG
jgi:cytochrome c biogenesis protein CcdA